MVTTRTLTVKQTKIDPAFQTAKAEESILSILYTQDGLSFLVKHLQTKQVYMFGYVPKADLSPTPIQDVLSAFPERPAKIVLAAAFNNATLLPEEFADQNMDWTAPVLGGMANFHSSSTALKMHVYASVEQNVLDALQVEGVELQHLWLAQMEQLKPGKGEHVWTHLFGDTVMVLAAKDGKWELANNFPCENKEEFIYHLGNVVEQLGYDRASLKLEISGSEAGLYKEFITPYFASISIFKPKDWAQISSALQDWQPGDFAPLLRL